MNKTADNIAKVPGKLHVHTEHGREQNSAIHENAQWSSDQLHVRIERWIRGLDEGNPATC